ncbi:LITAF domain-containing protein-like [Dysidea avara]|uniref:LITAF domain-containing protein-like n=1 Tax=Dysidea avara TaxID=196820 RepID=UPI00331C9307
MSETEKTPLVGNQPPPYNPETTTAPPYPPSSGQAPPYPPSSEQPPQVTVVTQPATVVVPTSYGEYPVNIMCPNCRNQVSTKVEYESGTLMWILVLVLCLLGLWPCCLIPFCVDGCKDVSHTCPVCNSRLGVYKRM